MDLLHFLILGLATWRISSLLTNDSEHGPFGTLSFIRKYGRRLSEVFECLWCCSIWIGVILTVAYYYVPVYTAWLCMPLAFSALAIAWERING
jgi:hypothetical protein